MKKTLMAVLTATLLSGCASLEPNMKDGKEYAGRFPVLYHATVADFQYEDKSGTVHSLAKGTADTLSTGTDSLGTALSMGAGFSAAGGGALIGLAGTFLDAFAATKAPKPPQIVLQKENGDMISIAAPNVYFERAIKFHCLDVGEPVKVVDDGTPYLYIMHEDPRLHRRAIYEPSCESLREKYNVPLQLQAKSTS